MFLNNLRQRSPPSALNLAISSLFTSSIQRSTDVDFWGPGVGIEVFSIGVVERSFDFESKDDLRPGVTPGAVLEADVVEDAEGEDE
ncbi:hypothetical protein BELL_1353g00020 [Botrytis elliptica]|uniref:Uncharacterized protein n=1 Tax=Botrytis elliptica TaxID=278938 RepID=A0A4Z1IKP8_9HELO|nr:hypothetical protein BELL_1353g00020 [Botrytis elliptica]